MSTPLFPQHADAVLATPARAASPKGSVREPKPVHGTLLRPRSSLQEKDFAETQSFSRFFHFATEDQQAAGDDEGPPAVPRTLTLKCYIRGPFWQKHKTKPTHKKHRKRDRCLYARDVQHTKKERGCPTTERFNLSNPETQPEPTTKPTTMPDSGNVRA